MKILAIETSTNACSVALLCEGKVLQRHAEVPREHVKKILLFIDELLKEANCQLKDLSAIAVGDGPGSFTGLRIAASVAQGLAFAVSLPLAPVSSLRVLAQTAFQRYAKERILVRNDARMNEIYQGYYQLDIDSGLMCSVRPDELISAELGLPEDFIADLIVGSACDEKMYPEAAALCDLAVENIREKRIIDAEMFSIRYLRDQVVN